MNKLLITGCLLATAFAAVAMPTKKELAAAQKRIEDVIAPDVRALNAGRKTVKDVADIQMKLAADAQSEAEKYLLLQSAFKLYSRGEEFDSAAKALTAITRDIKDVPPELITELVDKEFNRDMGLKAPREVEMAERAAQRQQIMAMQKELEKTRSERPVLKRQGLLGGTLRARRLQRQQEAQAATQLQATVDGYTWSYRVSNGEAEIVAEKGGKHGCAVSPTPTGNLVIPSALGGAKVKSIGYGAFFRCRGLTSVTLPESVRNIENYAFEQCSSLKSVSIPLGVRTIGYSAFSYCALTSVTIPKSVTSIEGWAFCGCDGLESLSIPESVRRVDKRAFYNCHGLTSVTMCGEPPSSDEEIFAGCEKLKSIHVPANAKSWSGMTEWQGVPLVFDEEAKGVSAMTPVEREFKIGVAPGTVVEVDIGGCPLQFVSCPAGKFRMGFSEKPEVAACREIEISSPFWMTKGRLTMEQLRALGVQEGVTENKEGFACVNEASLMVEKLPQLLNKRFEGRIPEGYVFRLPTEAEFEYVQKAGAVGNDPRLAWGYSDDTDSVPNPWGVQKLFYSGRKDCFLDRVGGGKDVVSRFAHNRHWTDLVSINYENQPSRDPVGWCEGNRWAVLRRERNRKLTGRGLYGSTFYFVLAPDECRLNKFIWK